MSETVILRVGKRGEIYTTKDVRGKVGIRSGGLVKATIKDGKLIIEPIPSIEELLESVIVKVKPEDVERLSERLQREMGIYG